MPGDPGGPRIERVDLLPVAPFAPPLAAKLAQHLSRRLSVPCRVLGDEGVGDGPGALAGDGGQPVPVARVPGRDQADADALLARLEALPIDRGSLLVGATELDLGNPVFTYFFGRARCPGRAALVSVARLSPAFYGLPPDEDLLLRRATCEVLHELGHLAGLAHCRRADCVMRFAPTVEAIDARGGAWCDACAAGLPPGLLRQRSP